MNQESITGILSNIDQDLAAVMPNLTELINMGQGAKNAQQDGGTSQSAPASAPASSNIMDNILDSAQKIGGFIPGVGTAISVGQGVIKGIKSLFKK